MSKEIRKKIDSLYNELETTVVPGDFIFNPKILIISKKIEALQKECQHHFVNGICEFCDVEDD